MKHVFRLGFILIPFLFLVSTTAYPAGAPHHHGKKKASRAPAALSKQSVQLSHLSVLDSATRAEITPKAHVSLVNEIKPVTPQLGSGVGVAASVLSFP